MNQPQTIPLRLLQISDTHCHASDDTALCWSNLPVWSNRSLQTLLAHLAKQEGFEALVLSGDVVQEETAASYQRVREILTGFPLPIYTLPGNHDVPELMQEHLQLDGQIHLQPYLMLGNWRVLFLDTSLPERNDGHLNPAQLAALEQQLMSLSADQHALIFMHHHPVPIGSPWMDGMGLQQTEAFWGLLSHFPAVKAVAFGHIHHEFSGSFHTENGNTISIYGTPATCVQLKHVDVRLEFDHIRPGWREFTLHADGRLETTVHYLEI